jgi:hypothetical protein
MDRIKSPLVRINIAALGLMKEGSFNGLFWTLVLTGSIGAAIPVIFLSYTGHYLKQLFFSVSIVR